MGIQIGHFVILVIDFSFYCRVLHLEKKKETVKDKEVTSSIRTPNNKATSDDEDDDDDDNNFDEYIDWRAKKSYKKANKFIS